MTMWSCTVRPSVSAALATSRVMAMSALDGVGSPLGWLSVSMAIVPAVFIAEFHAMFAMYMNSVSILYGSAAQALRITMCISPWAASGASHEYALSMRV